MAFHKRKPNRPTDSQARARSRTRLFVALCAGCLVMLVAILLLIPAAFLSGGDDEKKASSVFGIVSVAVEGNTHYDDEAIVDRSGIKVGESVFALNKAGVIRRLKKDFPFVESAKITVSKKREVIISISEVMPMGAVYGKGNWIVVDKNGVAIQASPVTSQTPLRYCYLKGARLCSTDIGKQVLDDDSLTLLRTITTAAQECSLTGIGEIDISSRSDIRLSWQGRITIALGNDSNLNYEISAAANALQKVLKKNGDLATGLLNVSMYSDPTAESPAIVFTPSNLLDKDGTIATVATATTTAAKTTVVTTAKTTVAAH